jgi:hypothetical protein
MDGAFAGAEPGQAMRDRLAGHRGGPAGRFGQRQPGCQPGRQRR